MENKYKHIILLVDDEKSITKALRRLFRTTGFKIKTALSGQEGLDVLKKSAEPVSLIISDQRMPEMTGARFLEKARKIFPDAIRFLLTGYSDMDAIVDAVNKGEIHRYLTKPWNDDDLLIQVKQGIAQYEMVLENRRLNQLTKKQNKELKGLNEDLEQKVIQRTKKIEQKKEQLKESHIKLEKSFKDTIRLLASLIESLNPALGKQTKNVARFSKRIAEELGVEQETIDNIEMAGMIHDIGLLGLPEKLCAMDEKDMSGTEFKMYSNHPVIGSICLEAVERLAEVGEMILYHHERFNGKGFPSGLKGKEIPLGARIIGAVSDYSRINAFWPDEIKMVIAKAQRMLGPSAKNLILTDREALIDEVVRLYFDSRSPSYYDPDIVSIILDKIHTGAMDTEGKHNNKKVAPVHFDDLKAGMLLATTLNTKDGRLILPGDTVINEALLEGIKKLAKGKAIEEKIDVWDHS
ncbi:MAG: response regulator [Desulfobacterales bacterium]|nr:response regulator [Deltaproteobacteria bacterium]NNL41908.1 response regulator [Desulfobacterales bacterium]